MNARIVEEVASAVLYEGYILYPYRASAVKNRKRFNFGVVSPPAYCEALEGTATSAMQTECLVVGGPLAELEVKVRFLHIVARVAGKLAFPLPELPGGKAPDFRAVESVEVQGRVYRTWQEAAEREVTLPACSLAEIAALGVAREFSFPAAAGFEPLCEQGGRVAAVLMRQQEPLQGRVEVAAEAAAGTSALPTIGGDSLFRVRVRISNLTALDAAHDSEAALARSLVSTHTLLSVRGGEFVSLLDPCEPYKDAAAACRNLGTFPVLAGEEGRRDTLLSSPIILYDYPRVAAESAGQFFDGTEVDEMLALRIMTLTDDEKREMGQVDERARQLLERTEALPPERLMKLHGVLRGLRSVESAEEDRA
jgi:hypothetical protein